MPTQQAHLSLAPAEANCGGLAYFGSVDEVRSNKGILAFIRILERAWEDLGLTGVLCVDGIPTIYFKEVPAPLTSSTLNALHRRFWNQGVAQTLVVADPRTVRIFSGLAKPQRDDAALSEQTTLVKELSRLEFTQQIDSFCQANANGTWYAEHPTHYQSGRSVDAYLLDNLVALRNLLTKGKENQHKLPSRTAHALIGRVLFVCYLVDRGIYRISDRSDAVNLNEAIKNCSDFEAIDFLYDLFTQLKIEFNGSMFDQDLTLEKEQIEPFHIQILKDFLDGQKPMSAQHNLGFWAYDFKLIPVETISAIYEQFLAHEDPAGKRETGAFYTPRFLAEMTLDVALEKRADWHTLRYLDPCCGSGIFLVTLFNRLATRWLLDNPSSDEDPEGYLRKAKAMIGILTNNLRGVDVNPTACRLACFSLYIALLDCLSPSDIRTFVLQTKHKLPRLLADDTNEPHEVYIPVVREANFLEENGLEEKSFDYIIGNPPWQGKGAMQIALYVLEHAEKFMVDNGTGCLLLPSKIFLNITTNQFQSQWLSRMTVDRVVQLADYRKILFEQAKCPSMIVRYQNSKLTDPTHRIAYDTPKFNPVSRRRGLVTIASQDHKWLSQAQLQNAAKANNASSIWKRWLWGTSRDQRLLNYFDTMPKLRDRIDVLSEIRKSKGERSKPWAIGQGFKPFAKEDDKSDRPLVPMPWPLNTPFVASKTLSGTMFADSADTESLGKHLLSEKYRTDIMYSSPPKELFSPPFVLVNQGFTNFAFCDFPATFRSSLQSIIGSKDEEDILLFLTAYLSSRLARYILFHNAVYWGTERDKVLQDELLDLPFPMPGHAPSSKAQQIIETIASKMKAERLDQHNLLAECRRQCVSLLDEDKERATNEWRKLRAKRTKALQAEIEPLIHDYFGLLSPEKMLVDDTVTIFIPSSTPQSAESLNLPTLRPANNANVSGYEPGLSVYAEILAGTLNTWATERGSTVRVSPSIGVDTLSGMAMVTLAVGEHTMPIVTDDLMGNLPHWIKRGFEAFTRESNSFCNERELFWFDQGNHKLHVIRPLTLIHWTRTAALNDADTIYGEITLARRIANAC